MIEISMETANNFREMAVESVTALKTLDETSIENLNSYVDTITVQAGTELSETIDNIKTIISDLNRAILAYNKTINVIKNSDPMSLAYSLTIIDTQIFPLG